jgi:hypothetical protein
MGWHDVNMADVKPTFELLPKGDYVLEISGARYAERKGDTGGFVDISVTGSVVTPEEYAGRLVFMDYPDPDRPKCDWSKGALKRLFEALGVEQQPGEDLVEIINRSKGLHVTVPVLINTYKNANDEPVENNKAQLFKVRPAA